MLVLSLFPGLGLLDRAFEEEGFCVVRGPDLLWGGDIRTFHPPAGKFDGVIGGPPCQLFSPLKRLNPNAGLKHGDQIPEFGRCISEARPLWFVMENSPLAYAPDLPGYVTTKHVLNNRWLGEVQERTRAFWFATQGGSTLRIEGFAALEALDYEPAVTGSARRVMIRLNGSGRPKRGTKDGKRLGPGWGNRRPLEEMLRLQGFAPDALADHPFRTEAAQQMVGNGVPLPMGRAIARAVKDAIKGIEKTA